MAADGSEDEVPALAIGVDRMVRVRVSDGAQYCYNKSVRFSLPSTNERYRGAKNPYDGAY
jgi:hypothetical protein